MNFIKFKSEIINTRYIVSIAKSDYDPSVDLAMEWAIVIRFNDGEVRRFYYKSRDERDLNWSILRRRIVPISLDIDMQSVSR